jgi:hypothetical protein
MKHRIILGAGVHIPPRRRPRERARLPANQYVFDAAIRHNTMMVMMMAMTPSLKASSLLLLIRFEFYSKPLRPCRSRSIFVPLLPHGTLAVSEKSYEGKIRARRGRPVLTYINIAAARSTVMADPNIRGVSDMQNKPDMQKSDDKNQRPTEAGQQHQGGQQGGQGGQQGGQGGQGSQQGGQGGQQGGQRNQPGQQDQGNRESGGSRQGGQQTGGQGGQGGRQTGGSQGNDNNMNRKEGSNKEGSK